MGFCRTTWAPGMRQSRAEIATIVGFRVFPNFQISCTSFEEASPSQSITIRSALPFPNRLRALEELKQTLEWIERSRSIRSMVLNTPGLLEISKHSNAMSGVISASREHLVVTKRSPARG